MIKTYVLSADKLKIDEYSILCDGRTIINLNDEYTNKVMYQEKNRFV